LIILAAALGIWLFIVATYRREAIADISRDLIAMNAHKAGQVSAWRTGRIHLLGRVPANPMMHEALTQESLHPGSQKTKLAEWLEAFLKYEAMPSAAFLSVKGHVLAASAGYSRPTSAGFNASFKTVVNTGAPLVSDLYTAEDGTPGISTLLPISIHNRLFCVLAVNINPEIELYPLLRTSPLLPRTAETFLVRKEGGSVLILNDLAYSKGSALKLKFPLTEAQLPSVKAVEGYSGFFTGVDYRGKRVFSAINHINGANWAIITKIDRDIILAPIRTREYLALTLIMLTLIIFYGGFHIVLRAREEAGRQAIIRAGTALRESEQIFREFMEHSPIYIFFKDENIRALRLSRNYEAMLGKPLEELLGKSMDELFPSQLAKSMVADDLRILKEGKDVVVEEEFNGRNYRTIKFPIHLEGRPSYLAGYTIDITEQKRAQEALRQSNILMKNTQSLAKIGGWEWDLTDRTMHWTEEAYHIHDFLPGDIEPNAEEHIARSQQCYRPEDRPVVMAAFRRCTETGEPYDLEFPFTTAKGRRLWIRTTAKAEWEGGRISKVVGTISDITGRKLAEIETRRIKDRLVEAQRLARIGNWELDLATNRLEWSDEIYRIFEIDQRNFGASYEAFLSAIHPDDRENVNKAYTGSLKYKTSYDITHRLLMKDGRVKHVHEQCETFFAPDGKPLRSIGTVQDVTAQRIIEDELRGTEGRLRSLMNSMPDIVCFKDGEGRWLEANTFDLELFQLENVDYKGKKDSELAQYSAFYHDAFMACEASDEIAWSKGHISRGEEVIPRPDGNAYVFDIIKVPIFTPDGKRKALTVVGRDITERKRAETEKDRINRDLIVSKQEMENFLYITTHDLRSPLVNIQGFSQNLDRYIKELIGTISRTPLPDETRQTLEKLTGERVPEALAYVLDSSRKMDALITALLKVSRIGRVEMHPKAVEMNQVLKKITDSLRYQLQETSGSINCGGLPQCKADPLAVTQLFTNLLDNAIKYRHKDRALEVNVTGVIKGGMALYTVADNGAGIPAADLGRIWNVFSQADSTPTKSGEGIGLPMVKRIAEKNGGSIWAESKEGEGSVFYIKLPAAQGGGD